jgi:isopentenyldiphosphate isomerase
MAKDHFRQNQLNALVGCLMYRKFQQLWEEPLQWIEQHSWGLLIAYLLFLFTSYGSLWTLVESLGIKLSGLNFFLLVLLVSAHLTLAVEIWARRRRSFVRLRYGFWQEIRRKILEAKHEVIFLGGISSSLLNATDYSLFADSLARSKQLRFEFFYESSDNLFRRSQYCERPLETADRKTYLKMLERKSTIEDIPSSIQSLIKDMHQDEQIDILNRLIVKEIHLQLYMAITKIDDIIYLTSISNRRNSRSPTIRLADKKDPFYMMAVEYINYFKNSKLGEPYCTPPGEEILQVFDEKGISRGFCARETVRKIPGLRVKVVFGFVFNREGKLLLQKRSDKARDNKRLWDKSFGGHMNSELDISIIETARREFFEELLSENGRQTVIHYLGQWDSENFNYRDEFGLGKFLLFNLYEDPLYESSRMADNGQIDKQICLSFNVAAFVIFCPSQDLICNSPDVLKHKWISISDLEYEVQ